MITLVFKIFQVIVYGLMPLAFLSTLLSSSMRKKRQARRLNKTKIVLTIFSGFLVYLAATFLAVYSNENKFFSCNLTTIVPRNGPWDKLDQLSSIHTKEAQKLLSKEYLFDENLWMTLGKIDFMSKISRIPLIFLHFN